MFQLANGFVFAVVFSAVSVSDSFDSIQFVKEIGSNICRYTDFCHKSRRKTLADDDLMPCCLSCDCSKDCWKIGNCCPDRSTTGVQTPELTCKQTLVKRISYDKDVYDGYSLGVSRYRIVDSCPSDETNKTLIDGCQMTKKTIEEYTWVSDETGKIFQNRFCAYCHNVQYFTEWYIRTRYSPVLLSNFSNLQQSILSDECDLIVEVPENDRRVTDHYRCLIPEITECNATGLWRTRDLDIEQACATYNSPVIKRYDVFFTIYSNIYCLVCNGYDETLETELCPHLDEGTKAFHTIEFSALVDFSRRQENENKAAGTICELDQVYDPAKDTCYKLLCPFGNTPFYGACESIALETYGLAVQIDYNLTVLQNQSSLNATAFESKQEAFGKAVFDSFTQQLSPRAKKCSGCDNWHVRWDGGTEFQDSKAVILTAIIYTNEQCQLNDINAKYTEVLNKEIQIEFDDKIKFDMAIQLDKRSFRSMRKLAVIYSKHFKSCSIMIRLNDERLCPEVQLISRDLTPEIIETVTINTETPVDGVNFTLVTLCWEDYVAAISINNMAASAFAPQFQIAAYVSQNVCAFLAMRRFLHM